MKWYWAVCSKHGKVYSSEDFQDYSVSPYRVLMSKLAECGDAIKEVVAVKGTRVMRVSAKGDIVIGMAFTYEKALDGSGSSSEEYGWVCDQLEDEWVWHITNGRDIYKVVTTPGEKGKEQFPNFDIKGA